MVARFEPPRQWEDWASWGLGIWLILSPWALLYCNDTPATENAVLAGFLLILIEAVTLSAFRVWEEWVNVAVGTWLVLSPPILAVPAVPAGANFVIVGALVIVLAIYEMWDNWRQRSSGA
jgi:SPW repeat